MFKLDIRPGSEKILIVEDDEGLNELLCDAIESEGYPVKGAFTLVQAEELVSAFRPVVCVLDLSIPKKPGGHCETKYGERLFGWIKTTHPETIIILCSGKAQKTRVLTILGEGAYHYLDKPVETRRVVWEIRRALEHKYLLEEKKKLDAMQNSEFRLGKLVGISEKIQKLFEQIKRAGGCDDNVLVTGENGTGKNLVAETIHAQSARAEKMFQWIDCPTISGGLFESELFGHKKGAFTSATATEQGILRATEGGTVFFDEIADLTTENQAKLLKVVQAKEFKPLGFGRSVQADIRVIAATNKDLKKAITEGKFRQDLYYRLNRIRVHVPALRERKEDIRFLVNEFFSRKNDKHLKRIERSGLQHFLVYDWPGNVRELKNCIISLIKDANTYSSISEEAVMDYFVREGAIIGRTEKSLKDKKTEMEIKEITKAIRVHGSVKGAAKALGYSRQTLHRKLKEADAATL